MNKVHLQLIDHERVIVKGKNVINECLKDGDLSPLVNYLENLHFDPVESIVEYRKERIEKIISLNCPSEMVEHEKESLAMVTGEAYCRERLIKENLEDLRAKLVNLFIPWSEIECFLKNDEYDDIKRLFPHLDILPRDNEGSVLIPMVGDLAGECCGYFTPEEVLILSDAIKETDILRHESEEIRGIYEFIIRAVSAKYGLYYDLGGVNS